MGYETNAGQDETPKIPPDCVGLREYEGYCSVPRCRVLREVHGVTDAGTQDAFIIGFAICKAAFLRPADEA